MSASLITHDMSPLDPLELQEKLRENRRSKEDHALDSATNPIFNRYKKMSFENDPVKPGRFKIPEHLLRGNLEATETHLDGTYRPKAIRPRSADFHHPFHEGVSAFYYGERPGIAIPFLRKYTGVVRTMHMSKSMVELECRKKAQTKAELNFFESMHLLDRAERKKIALLQKVREAENWEQYRFFGKRDHEVKPKIKNLISQLPEPDSEKGKRKKLAQGLEEQIIKIREKKEQLRLSEAALIEQLGEYYPWGKPSVGVANYNEEGRSVGPPHLFDTQIYRQLPNHRAFLKAQLESQISAAQSAKLQQKALDMELGIKAVPIGNGLLGTHGSGAPFLDGTGRTRAVVPPFIKYGSLTTEDVAALAQANQNYRKYLDIQLEQNRSLRHPESAPPQLYFPFGKDKPARREDGTIYQHRVSDILPKAPMQLLNNGEPRPTMFEPVREFAYPFIPRSKSAEIEHQHQVTKQLHTRLTLDEIMRQKQEIIKRYKDEEAKLNEMETSQNKFVPDPNTFDPLAYLKPHPVKKQIVDYTGSIVQKKFVGKELAKQVEERRQQKQTQRQRDHEQAVASLEADPWHFGVSFGPPYHGPSEEILSHPLPMTDVTNYNYDLMDVRAQEHQNYGQSLNYQVRQRRVQRELQNRERQAAERRHIETGKTMFVPHHQQPLDGFFPIKKIPYE